VSAPELHDTSSQSSDRETVQLSPPARHQGSLGALRISGFDLGAPPSRTTGKMGPPIYLGTDSAC